MAWSDRWPGQMVGIVVGIGKMVVVVVGKMVVVVRTDQW